MAAECFYTHKPSASFNRHFLYRYSTLFLLFFIVPKLNAQPDLIFSKIYDAGEHLNENLQYLNDFQENIRKAQNSVYIQDINLYLDISLVHYDQFRSHLAYAENLYLDIFEIIKDSSFDELKYKLSKAYNRLLIIETEINRINDYLNELKGLSAMPDIQQKLSMLRTSAENIGNELPLCLKENKNLIDLLQIKDE